MMDNGTLRFKSSTNCFKIASFCELDNGVGEEEEPWAGDGGISRRPRMGSKSCVGVGEEGGGGGGLRGGREKKGPRVGIEPCAGVGEAGGEPHIGGASCTEVIPRADGKFCVGEVGGNGEGPCIDTGAVGPTTTTVEHSSVAVSGGNLCAWIIQGDNIGFTELEKTLCI
eukprot:Gb_25877 [translate_table: standard]